MCTIVILFRPDNPWPLLIAGNRDEMRERRWLPPARHWQDRSDVVGGLDLLGGGSWFGMNDSGVVAVILNREGTLGPATGKRSRGELVLKALKHVRAMDAAQAIADLDSWVYRAFNLLIADPESAFWVRNREDSTAIEVFSVLPGLHMLTARDIDDQRSGRIGLYLPRFRAAQIPNPATGDWRAWKNLLASRLYRREDGPQGAMNLTLAGGFGTICSHLVALPRYPGFADNPIFLFAAGSPDQTPFEPVNSGYDSLNVRPC